MDGLPGLAGVMTGLGLGLGLGTAGEVKVGTGWGADKQINFAEQLLNNIDAAEQNWPVEEARRADEWTQGKGARCPQVACTWICNMVSTALGPVSSTCWTKILWRAARLASRNLQS